MQSSPGGQPGFVSDDTGKSPIFRKELNESGGTALPVASGVRASLDSASSTAARRELLLQKPDLTENRVEAEPDGGLTFSEQAMLRSFAVRGTFQPAILHSVADRFDALERKRFAASRERMAAVGAFDFGAWLMRRARFAVQIWRVRMAIRLYEMGALRFRGTILDGIYSLNRQYFSEP